MAAALFHGRRFYLTRTIAPMQRVRARDLILERGGKVTANPHGAIQLVGPEHLDPRKDWVSVDFVLDSVARDALQDLSDYMGAELPPAAPGREKAPNGRQSRVKYSEEDDARMLVFLQSNFGHLNKSMESVPLSVWDTAARRKVTNHSGQSMHERYRKQLRTKTPLERREIIAKGMHQARGRAAAREEEEDKKEEREEVNAIEDETEDKGGEPAPVEARAPPTTPPAPSEQPKSSPASEQPQPPHVQPVVREDTSDQAPAPVRRADSGGDSPSSDDEEVDMRPRKRLRRAAAGKEPSSRAAAAPAAAEISPRSSMRRRSSPGRSLGRPPLHREANRRQTIGVVTRSGSSNVGTRSQTPLERSSSNESFSEEEGKVVEGEEGKEEARPDAQEEREELPRTSVINNSRSEQGVFFRSIWAAAFADPLNRNRLLGLFEPSEAPFGTSSPSRAQQRTAEPPTVAAASLGAPLAGPAPPSSVRTPDPQPRRSSSLSDGSIVQQTPPEEYQPPRAEPRRSPSALETPRTIELSTERELDAQLCRIQFETKASLQTIVHALYYASGDYATATAFLKGQVPAEMWSPEDDRLLVALISAATTASDVEAAARAGAFAAMRVQRSAGDVLARIRYLL